MRETQTTYYCETPGCSERIIFTSAAAQTDPPVGWWRFRLDYTNPNGDPWRIEHTGHACSDAHLRPAIDAVIAALDDRVAHSCDA